MYNTQLISDWSSNIPHSIERYYFTYTTSIINARDVEAAQPIYIHFNSICPYKEKLWIACNSSAQCNGNVVFALTSFTAREICFIIIIEYGVLQIMFSQQHFAFHMQRIIHAIYICNSYKCHPMLGRICFRKKRIYFVFK